MKNSEKGEVADFGEAMKSIVKMYMETPLAKMQPEESGTAGEVFLKASRAVEGLIFK